MKYLKIESNQCFYIKDSNTPTIWTKIDQIDKDDLMMLLEIATTQEFELDNYDENLIGNKAHQIIYKHISEKFTSLLNNKDRFKDEADNMFKVALEKYQ